VFGRMCGSVVEKVLEGGMGQGRLLHTHGDVGDVCVCGGG